MADEEKLFYSIGEASQIVDVKPYVLRYWETEFRKLNPQKSESGQRTYRKKDIQVALAIKRLLYEEKYTIAGALQKLEELEKAGLDQLDFFPPKSASPSPESSPGTQVPPDQPPRSPAPVPARFPKAKITEFKNLLSQTKVLLGKYLDK